jgi:pimeloyl-ACP methyl ester carboxylesterase
MKRSIIQGFAAIATSSSSITCKYSQPLLVEELQIRISDGNVLAAKRWTESYDGNPKSSRLHTILCLHGWLDNCASFHHLAPVLASKLKATQVVAMDFPGHGHSSHKGLEAPPMVQSEMVYYVCEAIEALLKSGGSESNTKDSKYQRITLVGHSLGAGVASLTTAAFPEYVETLVLLDAASFLARRAEDTALHVRDHVARRLNHEPFRESRIYRSLDLAVKVRRQAAKKMPGKQSLSYKAAKELVQRGTRSSGDDGELQYRHDFR